jgi:hypothetical protein
VEQVLEGLQALDGEVKGLGVQVEGLRTDFKLIEDRIHSGVE